MEEVQVYILYSENRRSYYVGQTKDLDDRLSRHNGGRSKSTKHGVPWRLVKIVTCKDRSEASKLERLIKGRGAKRYLGIID